jgi:hypothetical protein
MERVDLDVAQARDALELAREPRLPVPGRARDRDLQS